MSLLRKLAGQAAIYGLSSVLGRLLNYLLVPLYTAVFDPAQYGVVTELYAYVAFLNILYVYGLETAYFRFSREDESYFHTAFTSILFSSLLFSAIVWMGSDFIAELLDYPGNGIYIKWLSAILALDAIVAIPFAKLRMEGKAKQFALFKLSNIGINIGLNLFFILLCPWITKYYPNHPISQVFDKETGVGYVFLSNLIANAAYIVLFIPLWRKIKIWIDREEWKNMMNYAWPILIIGFAGVTNEMLSRAILKYRLPEGYYHHFSNQEVLGIFGACYKLSVFMTLAVQAFRYAFEPFFFAQAKEKNSKDTFSRVMTYFVLFTAFCWLVLCLFSPYYAPIFLRRESYLAALDAVPWLLGGGVLLGVFYNLSIWYKLTDKTLYGAYISLIGAAVTFILNWILIPEFGYMGSAYTTFISYFIMVAVSYLWGKRHYKVPYEVVKISLFFMMAAIGISLNEFMDQSVIFSIVIVVIFLTLAFVIERKSLKRLSKTRL